MLLSASADKVGDKDNAHHEEQNETDRYWNGRGNVSFILLTSSIYGFLKRKKSDRVIGNSFVSL